MTLRPLRAVRTALFVIAPAMTALLALPVLYSVRPAGALAGEYPWWMVAIVIGVYLGGVSAPGYVYALVRSHGLKPLSRTARRWVVPSLALSFIVCAGAFVGSFLTFGWPLSLLPLAALSMSGWLLLENFRSPLRAKAADC